MKSKLSLLLTSAVLAMSLASTATFAFDNGTGHQQYHGKDGGKHMQKAERFKQHKFKKMARYLDLSDEQRQLAKALHLQAKEDRAQLKETMQSFHQQSKSLITSESFDEQAFVDLQNQHQDTFAQMALIKAKTKHNFLKLLTAEQKEKLHAHKGFGKKRPNFWN